MFLTYFWAITLIIYITIYILKGEVYLKWHGLSSYWMQQIDFYKKYNIYIYIYIIK